MGTVQFQEPISKVPKSLSIMNISNIFSNFNNAKNVLCLTTIDNGKIMLSILIYMLSIAYIDNGI